MCAVPLTSRALGGLKGNSRSSVSDTKCPAHACWRAGATSTHPEAGVACELAPAHLQGEGPLGLVQEQGFSPPGCVYVFNLSYRTSRCRA